MSSAETVTSIFDLDGVLTREDTMASLVSSSLAACPGRLVAASAPFLLAQAAPPDGALRPAMNRAIVSLALRGMTRRTYESLAVATGHAMARRTTVVEQAVARCRSAGLHGPTVVATASEETLARAFLDGLGLRGIPLAASRLDFTRRGPRLSAHNVGQAKVAAVRAMGFVPEQAVLYTDSASDIPLARVARRTVTVNAARRSSSRLAAVANEITHERWT
ncbi:HAD family hydrolase [Streptomyces sp. LHD-70]|uniref:HAD family hydrolase n=1 Tax=Streptomyces sp. LHD-70 TaxID=3072140 RepID=UPI0028101595|nr:HAD family hydrolase [Streptomyces sp. LHD-70]MDQ8708088.1 HAD family hydrolase [Streptomyces sp. LHD-70]